MLTKILLILFAVLMAWRLLFTSRRRPPEDDRPRLEADQMIRCERCGTFRLPGPMHRCDDPDCP